MTRYARRKTRDRLHCTYSAIIDIFEMENNREPTSQEISDIILTVGDCGTILNRQLIDIASLNIQISLEEEEFHRKLRAS